MKKNIILVDDDRGILTLVKFILDKDYNVILANNGVTALQLLDDNSFKADLIITDLNMPYLNGQTLINQLRISGFYRHIPILVLSAEERLQDILNQLKFQVEGYIKKPFNPTELKQEIFKILPPYEEKSQKVKKSGSSLKLLLNEYRHFWF